MQSSNAGNWHGKPQLKFQKWEDVDRWEDEQERFERRLIRGKAKIVWRRRPYHDAHLLKDDKQAG